MQDQLQKKILIIADSFPTRLKPSIGNFYLEQALALKSNFDFQVIVLEAKELMFLRFFGNKRFKKFNDPNDGTLTLPIIRLRFNRIRQNRISIFFSFIRNRIVNRNYKTGCNAVDFGFKNILKADFMPDLILAETAQYMAPFAVFLGSKYNIPVVGYEHYPPLVRMTTVWEIDDQTRRLLVNSLNQLSLLFSTSQFLTNVLYLVGVNIAIENIGNMVNENSFCIKPKIYSNFFYVTYVGYLNILKDPFTMFQCIREIKRTNGHNIRFRIINGVNEFGELIDKFNISDIVENLENVPRDEMIKIISQQTDVLVSTSTSETFGLTMIEALMCGVPVVATKSGGNQDFLTSQNSILIENKDFKSLAESILKIKNREIVFDGQYLRNSVLHKFGIEAFTKRYCEHLNTVLNKESRFGDSDLIVR